MKYLIIILFALFISNNLFSQPEGPLLKEKLISPELVKKQTVIKRSFVWIDSQWNFEKDSYKWISGHWLLKKPGYVFINGYWNKKSNGWTWTNGYWKKIDMHKWRKLYS